MHVTGARAVIVNNRIHDALHGVYVRAGRRRPHRGQHHPRHRDGPAADRSVRVGGKPSEGELCEVSLNQNRRGNGIHIWNSSRHVVARNTIRDTRDGVYFSFVDRSEVRDNDIEGVRYGLHYMYSDENRFEGNVFRDNAAGAALMNSKGIVLRHNRFLANQGHRSYGILLQTVERTTLEAQRIAGNTVGVFFESGHGNRLIDNTIARNHIGIHASDSSDGNEFAGNRFVGNLHTVETTGGNLTSRWSIDGRGNYWDGAVTLDLDRDGIADVPHRELDLFGGAPAGLPGHRPACRQPGERLLRFVHARIALPGLPGVHRSRAARPAHHGHDHHHRTDQVVRSASASSMPSISMPAQARSRCSSAPTGCGKTTTLRQLCGLSSPDAGRIAIGWPISMTARMAALAQLSFLPQSPRFHARLDRWRDPAISTRGCAVCRRRASRRSNAHWRARRRAQRRPTGKLSGGTRQRLALAVLSLPDAPVLVLDEPGLSLDPDWRRFLQAELHAAARRGATVLVATHLLGEWDGQADRCLVLEGGRVGRELPPARLREAFPFALPHPVLARAV